MTELNELEIDNIPAEGTNNDVTFEPFGKEITVDDMPVEDYYINDDKIFLKQPVISDNIIVTFTAGFSTDLPQIIKLTVLRIAALLQTESNNNIGISGKSFMDGSRTFMNFVNYDKYLIQCSKYKLI